MAKEIQEKGADALHDVRESMPGDTTEVPGPSPNPATNLIMADIAMRAGSYILRDVVERGFLKGRYGKETAKEIVAGKSVPMTIASFAAAKVATRSVPGAVAVGGAILVKNLFDRSQRRRKAKKAGDQALLERADNSDD